MRKGAEETNVKGVDDAKNNKPSGPNLDKLGIGVGKIAAVGGVGAIKTNFKNSAGGAGGGTGSAPQTLGLGGLQAGKSLGIAGAASAVSQFGGEKMVSEKDVSQKFRSSREGLAVNVRATDPLIAGGMNQEEISEVVNKNMNQIPHCYQRLLQKEPGISGKVNLAWVISGDGSVGKAEIRTSSLGDDEFNACLTSVVKRWVFPKPRGGADVSVSYPFQFSPIT